MCAWTRREGGKGNGVGCIHTHTRRNPENGLNVTKPKAPWSFVRVFVCLAKRKINHGRRGLPPPVFPIQNLVPI